MFVPWFVTGLLDPIASVIKSPDQRRRRLYLGGHVTANVIG